MDQRTKATRKATTSSPRKKKTRKYREREGTNKRGCIRHRTTDRATSANSKIIRRVFAKIERNQRILPTWYRRRGR